VEPLDADSNATTSPFLLRSPTSAKDDDESSIVGMELNQTLQTLGVTPVRPSDSRKRFSLARKLSKATVSLTQKVKKFARKSFSVPAKKQDCSFCTTLLHQLAEKFSMLTTKADKYKALTSVPKRFSAREIGEKFDASLYQIRKAIHLRKTEGHFSWPTFDSTGRPLPENIKKLIQKFYLAEENSRVSPVARESVYVVNEKEKRVKQSKYRILLNLNDLFSSFSTQYPDISISVSKFAELRPKKLCLAWKTWSPHNMCV